MRRLALYAALVAFLLPPAASAGGPALTVGSKAFPESWILGEALRELASRAGEGPVEHRQDLGGTEIVYQALRSGGVDVYPEYTGTVSEVILKSSGHPTLPDMRVALAAQGIGISEPLGFNDGYAIAVTGAVAAKLGLASLSDLARHPEVRLGLSHEFLGRKDGYPGLAARYGLAPGDVQGIQHELAYQALASGKIDGTDIYTTDAEISRLGLKVLADDRGFFPRYEAVLLYRLDLPGRRPRAWAAITRLEGRVNETTLIRANAALVLEKQPLAVVAADLLRRALPAAATGTPGVPARTGATGASRWISDLARNTLRHIELVLVSLLASVFLGIPLGILATRSRWLAQLTLSFAGVLQTIPSLALLAFLIPVFGIGVAPALLALFLYGLLPVVRNTYVGISTLPRPILESAEALGLTPRAQLIRVMLPMASPAILAGVKTSAVIGVGTATLAALVGAGGLGEPILSGIQLRDTGLILRGAVPAALLALVVQWGFDLVERFLVPRGLKC